MILNYRGWSLTTKHGEEVHDVLLDYLAWSRTVSGGLNPQVVLGIPTSYAACPLAVQMSRFRIAAKQVVPTAVFGGWQIMSERVCAGLWVGRLHKVPLLRVSSNFGIVRSILSKPRPYDIQ